MATKSSIKVNCKINRFEDNPTGGVNVFIDCNIGMRTWQREFWVNYDRPISMEKFKKDLKQLIMPTKDEDNLRFVKQEADKPFTLEISL